MLLSAEKFRAQPVPHPRAVSGDKSTAVCSVEGSTSQDTTDSTASRNPLDEHVVQVQLVSLVRRLPARPPQCFVRHLLMHRHHDACARLVEDLPDAGAVDDEPHPVGHRERRACVTGVPLDRETKVAARPGIDYESALVSL